jgi:hypothetical protein
MPVLGKFQPDVGGSQCYSMDLAMLKPVLETVNQFNPKPTTIIGDASISNRPLSCGWRTVKLAASRALGPNPKKLESKPG